MTARTDGLPIAPGSRISAAPEVRALLKGNDPDAVLARQWTRYAQGLIGENGVQLEDVVAADIRCIELEPLGLPPGLAGFRLFRDQMNAAMPDEWTLIEEMRVFPSESIVEAALLAGGTHLGPLMGIAPTGRPLQFRIHTLNRFDNGRMALRWDRLDVAALIAQIS